MNDATPLRQAPGGRDPGSRAPPLPPGEIRLNEVYVTIQGECAWMGTPTVFVRTSHCPLRCVWCDSKYTFTQGTPWRTDDVVERVRSSGLGHVCLTGGEPLAQPESLVLAERLAGQGFTVEIETSGSEDVSALNDLPQSVRGRITVNLDVKCPGSAMTNFNRWENLSHLRPHDQVKFVVADRNDFDYALGVLDRHPVPCAAWAHPVWDKQDAAELAQWVRDARRPRLRMGIQLHKVLWGDVRGV